MLKLKGFASSLSSFSSLLQADVWVELLKRLAYRQLVFVHSSDTDGRALLGRFQTRTQDLQAERDNDQEVKVQVG